MAESKRKVHGGLILAGGLLAASMGVLILGAARGQATDAGLVGSVATPLVLRDAAGRTERVGHFADADAGRTTVLLVARDDANPAKLTGEAKRLCDVLGHDGSVRLLGVQVATDDGLLNEPTTAPVGLEQTCPQLRTLRDTDASLAHAYRVTGPTVLVLDDHDVLRARVPLDGDGTAVTVVEVVNSLRPTRPHGVASPALPH